VHALDGHVPSKCVHLDEKLYIQYQKCLSLKFKLGIMQSHDMLVFSIVLPCKGCKLQTS
jgi:hypothetical protein